MKKIYRIEIGDTKYWIGIGNQLFKSQDMAVPVTHDDHIWVMENIDVPAVAYSEEFNPEIHTMGSILEGLAKR